MGQWNNCEFCANYEYDEDDEAYYCVVDMDEDDMARYVSGRMRSCPFFQSEGEYAIVKHQM